MLDGQQRIERIWKRYARTRSQRLREELILHYQPLVQNHARKVGARLPRLVDRDDLISVGMLGLMAAIEDFDVTQGTRFETYCALKIPGAMLDELRALDWATRHVRQHARMVSQIIEKMESQTGRTPTDAEIYSCLPGSPKQRAAILRNGRPRAQYSLSTVAGAARRSDGDVSAMQIEDRRSPDPQREAACRLAKQWLLRGLSRGERLILILYYYEELSMKEIGVVLGLSESRVSQIHKLLLERLRAQLKDQRKTLIASL